MNRDISEKILEIARSREVFRPRDVSGVLNPGPQIKALVEKSVLLRVGYGLYTLADREPSESFSLGQALTRVPNGIVCLISALEYHGFTSQIGYQVWLAIGDKRPLTVNDIPVKIVRMSGKSFSEGIEKHQIGNQIIRVYSPAKTVADCFKFRRLVGLDVAIEALREGWRGQKFQVDNLVSFARINRVEKLMTPYIETVIA